MPEGTIAKNPSKTGNFSGYDPPFEKQIKGSTAKRGNLRATLILGSIEAYETTSSSDLNPVCAALTGNSNFPRRR